MPGITPKMYIDNKRAKQRRSNETYISAVKKYWIIKNFGAGALELPNKDVELMLEAQGVVNFAQNVQSATAAAEAKALGKHGKR